MGIEKWFVSDASHLSNAIVKALSGKGDSRPERFSKAVAEQATAKNLPRRYR